MHDENWRPVVGFETAYEVSDCGRVKSMRNKTNTVAGKILTPWPNGQGYPCVSISRYPLVLSRTIHRLVCEAFIGPRPKGLQINHKNGVKTDSYLANLEYVTPKENTRHSICVLGKNQRGEMCGTAKLVNEQVWWIRRLYARRCSQRMLARCFEVSKTTIARIVARKVWNHI